VCLVRMVLNSCFGLRAALERRALARYGRQTVEPSEILAFLCVISIFVSSCYIKLKGSMNYCSDNAVASFECNVSSAEVGDSMIRLLDIGLLLLFFFLFVY
jgi:hypothetical protein